MIGPDNAEGDLRQFADGLRRLLRASRFRSFRALAKELHYSHEIVSKAARGQTLPSFELTMAFVAACGGDPEEWASAWHALSRARNSDLAEPVVASPAWPPELLADGADPEASGCYADAITVHGRKVSLLHRRQVIGEIELRYSPRSHAAWGRFKGSDGLDKLALFRHDVNVVVGVERLVDGLRFGYSTEYGFDYHWGDIVLTGRGLYVAWVEVCFDGEVVATAETDRLPLI